MKPITDNLIAVVVPTDIPKFWIYWEGTLAETRVGNDASWITWFRKLDGSPTDWKIIGTITKSGEIDFDCEEYVEKAKYSTTLFKDYRVNETNAFYDAKHSFGSLLQSKSISLNDLKDNQKYLIIEKDRKRQ